MRATVNQLEIQAILEGSEIALVAQHLNLNTVEWKELRKELATAGFGVKVLHNRKAGKLLEDTRFENLKTTLKGPACLVFSLKETEVNLEKLLEVLTKQPKVVLVGGIVDSTLASVRGLQTISKLPAKESMLAGMVLGMESLWKDHLVSSLESLPKRLSTTLTASQGEMVGALSRLSSKDSEGAAS